MFLTDRTEDRRAVTTHKSPPAGLLLRAILLLGEATAPTGCPPDLNSIVQGMLSLTISVTSGATSLNHQKAAATSSIQPYVLNRLAWPLAPLLAKLAWLPSCLARLQ